MKPPTEMVLFRDCLMMARNIVILTGAGVSSESGIPTFRGAGGFWRRYESTALANAEAFRNNPSLVWEFYQYRRDVAYRATPNAGHIAIAKFEEMYGNRKNITVITQNVDGLHRRAGTRNLIELHGNLFKTRCTKCKEVLLNYDNPICPALSNVGPPDLNVMGSTVREEDLPHCQNHEDAENPNEEANIYNGHEGNYIQIAVNYNGEAGNYNDVAANLNEVAANLNDAADNFNDEADSLNGDADSYNGEADSYSGEDDGEEAAAVGNPSGECGGLLRPHIVWFGEGIEPELIEMAEEAVNNCDVCLICGTSSSVYPAAMLGPQAAAAGAIVAEFNTEPTNDTPNYPYFFQGLCGTTLPEALAPFN
ncbi:NAD-dependent protein deacylase sirtuin-5, mitochondrial-like [Pectinophora gossypiella]|uniref:NAD-dependent protein deacylase sirtuin-5, mitochondrial-like n=1 Tax=Pectinophora gossypiella TaxID=13191 RepID=UPI00214E93F4|nr:NAD-dependent protein deacylase sirtuin-5, mitochondrial-like [Pectinophora gossypiella]